MANAPYFTGEPGAILQSAPIAKPAPARGGMFGGRMGGVGSRIADFILAFGAAQGSPLGTMALRERSDQQQQDRELQLRAQQRRQSLEDQRNEWLYRQQWERANPVPRAPTADELLLNNAGVIDPNERRAAFADILANRREGQVQTVDVNGDGVPDTVSTRTLRELMGGRASPGPAAPTLAPGTIVNGMRFRGGDRRDRNNWEPIGGASQPGSRTFP